LYILTPVAELQFCVLSNM